MQGRVRRTAGRALCAGAALAVLVACTESEGGAPARAETPGARLSERIGYAEAEQAEAAAMVTLPAEVTLPPDAKHELGPAIPGRVLRWHIRVGEEIEVGDALADLASTELADLDAREQELKKLVRERGRVLRAQRKGVEAGVQTVQSLYELQLSVAEARAQLQSIRRQRDARSQLGVETRDGAMEWQWLAQVDGVVEDISCAPGTVQGPAATCLRLLDTSRAELRVRVPERFLPRVRGDVRLEWTPPWERDAAQAIPMRLTRRGAFIDPQTRARELFFEPDDEALPSVAAQARARRLMTVGATGRATLLTPAEPDTVRVPRLAVVSLEGKPTVFVPAAGADADALPRPLQVAVVGRLEGDPLVRGAGIAPGVRVVARGAFLVKSLHLLGE